MRETTSPGNSVIMLTLGCLLIVTCFQLHGQSSSTSPYVSKVWVADVANGQYKNPVIHADYSDPDVCRVGDDFYLVSSSFDAVPGLPILHSKDLVNWRIIGHALKRQPPFDHFSKTQHGNGVWAPSIRFHDGEFFLYYPDPDFGIYLLKSKKAEGPWSEPILVEEGKGLIDPCPLWNDDGKVYLVHAYAGSRAGIKSVIVVKQLNKEGTRVLDQGVLVYDGHELDPTIEGPKFYKRNGYYYIFAPAGGVSAGWQLVLRSKNIYGPYERKVVMDQGTTPINGPHQGAWVNTSNGEDWFIHFQDKEAYGRVVHLQPMKWVNDWPVIGNDKDGDGKGEPVLVFRKPNVPNQTIQTPAESDEFNELAMGLQWQWQANPEATWLMPTNHGTLRLFSAQIPTDAKNYWDVPNILLQKFPSEKFKASTKFRLTGNPKLDHERAGIIIMGKSYASLALQSTKDGGAYEVIYSRCGNASDGREETSTVLATIKESVLYVSVAVNANAVCQFSYSADGKEFINIHDSFTAESGKWIGAKVGIFCTRINQINDAGYADFDWFRIEPND
jgi:beta-xylosidase